MGKWTNDDTAEETGATPKQVAEASHDARDHAAGSGDLQERNENKVSDSPEGKEPYGVFKDAGMTPQKPLD